MTDKIVHPSMWNQLVKLRSRFSLLVLVPILAWSNALAVHADSPVSAAAWERGDMDLDSPGMQAKLTVDMSREADVAIWVVGPDGRTVRRLGPGGRWSRGGHTVIWDGKDDDGRLVPSEAYTVSIKERIEGKWVPVFEPNADNHGTRSKTKAIQWDPISGRLLISVDRPSRIRVWALHGDDGMLLSALKDMEPVGSGLLTLTWTGIDRDTELSLQDWGSIGIHSSGYGLSEVTVIVHRNGPESYLEARDRYPIDSSAAPRAYEDSSPSYRMEYGTQKRLRFAAHFDAGTLCITPDSLSLPCFKKGTPSVRVFGKNGKWIESDLTPPSGRGRCWTAKLSSPVLADSQAYDVVVSTNKEQFGYALVPDVSGASSRR